MYATLRYVLLASLLLCGSSVVRADTDPVTIPFERLKTGHMAISIKINGKGPYRVIFDTGAPVNVLASKAAKEAGVLPKDFKQPPLALFGAMGQHPIAALEVGKLKAEKVPAMVMDHPAVAALAKADGPLDGIVGFPFFARFAMTLDYQAKTLTFAPSKYEPEDILQALLTMLSTRKQPPPRLLAPAALWGLTVARKDEDDTAGVDVVKVLEGSPAAVAGLEPGDRLLTVDGRWTDSVEDAYLATMAVKSGTSVPVLVLRKGKEMKLTITPKGGL